MHQATIAHVRNADARVLLVLWHLADRWGRVTPNGILVPLPLTHQLLAQLTCLQRPTVSSAVGQLSQQGQLTRLSERGWLLHGEPPANGAAVAPTACRRMTTVRPRRGGAARSQALSAR